MKSNLHSHTQFCDGRSTMEEILLEAERQNYTEWGFSPHGPICIDSPCNMHEDNVTTYLNEIDRLRGIFPSVRILAGMEIDYLDKNNGPATPEVAGYGLDYIIGSVHFIPNQKGEFYDIDGTPERFRKVLETHFDNDLDYVVRTYWHQVKEMIRTGGFDIIGHIDKISLNASSVDPSIIESALYNKLINEALDLAIEKRLAIEINTKHWEKYGRLFPDPKFWHKIISAGIDMPVNGDTHYAEKVGESYEEILLMKQNIIS